MNIGFSYILLLQKLLVLILTLKYHKVKKGSFSFEIKDVYIHIFFKLNEKL